MLRRTRLGQGPGFENRVEPYARCFKTQLRKTSREGECSDLRVAIKAQHHIRNRPYRQLKMSLTMRVLNSASAGANHVRAGARGEHGHHH
jgi:hypothetical protein